MTVLYLCNCQHILALYYFNKTISALALVKILFFTITGYNYECKFSFLVGPSLLDMWTNKVNEDYLDKKVEFMARLETDSNTAPLYIHLIEDTTV